MARTKRSVERGQLFLKLYNDMLDTADIAAQMGISTKAVNMLARRRQMSLRRLAVNVYHIDHVDIGDVTVWFSPEDFEWVIQHRWYIDYYGYCTTDTKEFPKGRRMHQYVIDARDGVKDRSKHNIHHKDYNKWNNRRENLHDFPSPKAHAYYENYVCNHPNNPRKACKMQEEVLPF